NKIILDPLTFSEARFRPSLEERLESIISGAALMADSSCTRDDRRERIVAECNAVRQALQDLLSEYMNNRTERIFNAPSSYSMSLWVAVGHGSGSKVLLRSRASLFVPEQQFSFSAAQRTQDASLVRGDALWELQLRDRAVPVAIQALE
ncbi:catenin alpha-2 isoform X3, partial [Tachysurus ichikawai]